MDRKPTPSPWPGALLGLALAVFAWGCAAVPDGASRAKVLALAGAAGLAPVLLPTSSMPLAGFLRAGHGDTLTVYIEGDGRAYLDRRTPSPDPTPADPLGLRLASRDPAPNLLALARPGQYLSAEALAGCNPSWWTLGRFSPEVVAAVNQALDLAKARTGTQSLRLRGYSGGGGLAVLVAAGRKDVRDIVTIAGNLDTGAWTALHGVTPLAGSRNPADAAGEVAAIAQTHYVGSKDTITPPELCRRYVARLPAGSPARCVVIEGVGHHDGWAAAWERIVRQPVRAGIGPDAPR